MYITNVYDLQCNVYSLQCLKQAVYNRVPSGLLSEPQVVKNGVIFQSNVSKQRRIQAGVAKLPFDNVLTSLYIGSIPSFNWIVEQNIL